MNSAGGGLGLVLLTGITMIAFAANSVLCRYALGSDLIDAASFSALRLISGAAFLMCLVYIKDASFKLAKPRIVPVLTLLAYMLGFSFAYNQLSAATGALLLFGFVQITMLAYALKGGERPTLASIAGYAVAVSGLLYLVAPGLESPPPGYAGLMAIAGVAWGIYSLLGAEGKDPKPMEAVPSVESFAINRRSSIPVRSTIQSWLVSMSVDKSSFVTLFSGKYLPRPVIFELYCFIMR